MGPGSLLRARAGSGLPGSDGDREHDAVHGVSL
jgi:hypothetical protein